MDRDDVILELDGHEVKFSNPDKVFFSERGHTELGDFTLETVPGRLLEKGNPSAGLHESLGSLAALHELAARDEAEGLGDGPWPPHFGKQRGEPKRVQPSRAKKD